MASELNSRLYGVHAASMVVERRRHDWTMGGLRMPHSLQRGRWLRSVSLNATLCLSIASVNSLYAADGPNSAESGTQTNGRSVVREAETEDRTEYPGLTIVKPGFSTKAVRKQAIAELFLDRLNPEGQRKSQALIKNMGMFRRLPTISFECDPDVYRYFVKNPDVAVSTWRAMDISQFQLQESGLNQYRADAGDGSVGNVELLLQSPTETLIHCDGAFKSPLLPKPIVARSLMRLQTTFAKDNDGRIIGTHSGDVFVEFPSHAVEAVAKVIAPVSHNIADRNFKQMTLFVHLMSQAMAKRPDWIEVVGNKLDGIPKQKQQEFLDIGAKSYSESRRRLAIANGTNAFSPDDVLSPFRQWNADGEGIGSTQLSGRSGNARVVQSANQAEATTLQK